MQFSDRQQTTIAAAVTVLAAAILVGAVFGLIWLAITFLSVFSSVLLPLAVAGILAIILRPYVVWLTERRVPRPIALVIVLLTTLLPFLALGWFFGAVILGEVSDLLARLPGLWHKLLALVESRWPQARTFLLENPIGQRLQTVLSSGGDLVLHLGEVGLGHALSAGLTLARFVSGLLSWIVLPIYLVFFLSVHPDAFRDLDHLLPFLKPATRRDVLYLGRELVNILVAFFRGQLLVAFAQGILLAIAFAIIGLKYGLVLSLLFTVLNVIPYLGSMIGLSLAIPLALFDEDGGVGRLIAVLAAFGIVQLIEGYILTPKIMGDRTGLHPVAIIVSIFFWGTALHGILGMVLAIPLTGFLVVLWRLARDKYIREVI